MPIEILKERSVLFIIGSDAPTFLQNLVTVNIETLNANTVSPGALLTPQGKVAFDFLIGIHDGGFFIDISQSLIDDLIRRLTLYKLRADVVIEPLANWRAAAVWHEKADELATYRDLRFIDNNSVFRTYQQTDIPFPLGNFAKFRIENGVAESGYDYEIGDAFPSDIYLDINGGVDFAKGCYVGQEVVSRMRHRGTSRKRVAIITAQDTLPEMGTEVKADGKTIGKLGKPAGNSALAIVRVDRLFETKTNGSEVIAGDVRVDLAFPDWAKEAIQAHSEGDTN